MSLLDVLFRQSGAPLTVSATVIAGDAVIDPGFVFEIEGGASTLTLTMRSLTLGQITGKRFAVKVLEGDAGDLVVAVPGGTQIENEVGALASSTTIAAGLTPGTYREWLCALDGKWLLVTPPPPAADSVEALTFDTGDAIPLGTRPTTGQSLVYDGTNIKGAAAGESPDPWYTAHKAPASPHADTDEFKDASLHARWMPVRHGIWTPATPMGLVDASGTGIGTSNFRLTPNYRGTWLAWQGVQGGIWRTFTMPPVLQIRFRMAAPSSYYDGSPTSGFGTMYCSNTLSGVPDLSQNFVRWGVTNAISTTTYPLQRRQVLLSSRVNSGGNTDRPDPTVADRPEAAWTDRNYEFIMLFRASGGSTLCWLYLRNGPALDLMDAGTGGPPLGQLAALYYRFNNQFDINGSGNWNAIGLLDYARVYLHDDLEVA